MQNNRTLIAHPDDGAPCWLYPDGSHRCISKDDIAAINAALIPTPSVELVEKVARYLCKNNGYNPDAVRSKTASDERDYFRWEECVDLATEILALIQPQQAGEGIVEKVSLLHQSLGAAHACISGLGGNRELTYQYPEKANDLDWADRHISEALNIIERFSREEINQ